MTQSLHAIMWYLFIIWLPNLMRAMHMYLTSLNGVCVCVVRVKHIVRTIIHGLDSVMELSWQMSLVSGLSREANASLW